MESPWRWIPFGYAPPTWWLEIISDVVVLIRLIPEMLVEEENTELGCRSLCQEGCSAISVWVSTVRVVGWLSHAMTTFEA